MAKLFENAPGNSLNLKLMVKDKDNNNIFSESIGNSAIAGLLKHITDFIIFYAPTVNSYKRLKEPIYNNWNKFGYMTENNGANLIYENNHKKVLFTIPGADVNIYFTVFAMLTSVIFLFNLFIIK
jgi:glutamine synthetase